MQMRARSRAHPQTQTCVCVEGPQLSVGKVTTTTQLNQRDYLVNR